MPNRSTLRRSAAWLVLAGSAVAGSAALALPGFGGWSQPASVEALPLSATSLNTPAVDGCVSLSRNGLVLYFNSNRSGNQDLYRATRPSTADGFGAPERLPDGINTAADEFCPTIAAGNRLYFSRSRPGDPGDLMVSREGPDGWDAPEALGGGINGPMMEESAAFYEDATGAAVMLFSRRLGDGSGGQILASIDGGAPALVEGGPNGPASDNRPSITHDGLTLYFDSNRPGGLGGPDLWAANRASTADPFGPAEPLTALNSPGFDARPALSWDADELLFSSNRTGSESAAPDIWRTERSRQRGPKVIEF